jgi:outer membrane lipoprotein LolB
LKVDADPPQSFSAAFELTGTPGAGDLVLYTPIGTTLAVLSWGPQSAVLKANGEVRSFESLDALALHATGAALPISSLFGWLAGQATETPGWQADLSQLGTGRVTARRTAPLPTAELKLLLDQ